MWKDYHIKIVLNQKFTLINHYLQNTGSNEFCLLPKSKLTVLKINVSYLENIQKNVSEGR